jgi:hypothetical protein
MLKYKTYVKILSLVLIGIFGGVFIYIYIYAKNYPIPLFHSVSIDTKMMFMRDMENKENIDTLIVGSSIGLNNVQGVAVENSSKRVKHVLNLSGFGIVTMQVEQLLELTTLFPNLERVIYSAQFPDFSLPLIFENHDVDFVKNYINLDKNHINFQYSFYTYKHFVEFAKRPWNWEKKYMSNRDFSYLGFDHTGSAPLHIYDDDIIKSRWETPHAVSPIKENYLALERIVKKTEKKGINFYFIIQPYRIPLVKKSEHVRKTLESFDQVTKKIIIPNGGKVLNLHEYLHLNDNYFADRTHLNDKGSAISSKAIGKFIDKSELKKGQ